MGEFENSVSIGSKISEKSYFQSHTNIDDSAESIADSDLEDGELQKMLTSPLYAQKASGIPDALFSSEQGNLIRSSVFRNAHPSNLRGSLLEGNKDHLLNQARSDLAKQELHVESLNKCITELQRQTEEQRLALQEAQHGFVESRRQQIRLQEEFSIKEKVLRNTQIRNMHEIREMKRAQEPRIDEVSVQKLRENHETIQNLTSQLQEMQEQMNSMSDAGEFQEVESNYSGRFSYVSNQPVMIPFFSCFAQPRQKTGKLF